MILTKEMNMTNSSNNINTNTKVDSQQVVLVEASTANASPTKTRNKNALTHGIYAEDLILEWESEHDLMKLRSDLWAELRPEGCLEEETAVGIVNLLWLKRRVMRTAQLGFRRDPFAIEASASHPNSLDDLVQLMTAASSKKADLSQAAKESLDALKGAINKITEINMVCVKGYELEGPPKEAFQAAQRAQSEAEFVSKILSEQVFPRMTKLEEASKSSGGAASVYEKAYSHEHLERTLRVEAALDARIDKQMSRLVSLKEYKRIQKETSGPMLEATPVAPA
jgi:hypothetical protein